MGEFKTETEIMKYFRHMLDIFDVDMQPHQVMSHGYMSWYMLLYKTFPSLDTCPPNEKEFNHFCDVLFKDTKLTVEQQKILRIEGWKAYLED